MSRAYAFSVRYWRLFRERKNWRGSHLRRQLLPVLPRTDLVDIEIGFEYYRTWEDRYCAGYSFLSRPSRMDQLYLRYDEWMCHRKGWKLHTKESDSHYAEECGVRLIDE